MTSESSITEQFRSLHYGATPLILPNPWDIGSARILAVETGLAGCSIEDFAGTQAGNDIYARTHAIERVAAAVEVAHAIDPAFMVTARAENYLHGIRDLDDTLERLRGFEDVGADVVYAPGLSTLDEVARVTSSISVPVNVLAWGDFTVATLNDLEVSRISVGGRFARAMFASLIKVASQILNEGIFTVSMDTQPLGDLNELLNRFDGPHNT